MLSVTSKEAPIRWTKALDSPGEGTVEPEGLSLRLGGIGHLHQAVSLKLLGDLSGDHAKEVQIGPFKC